MSTLKIFALLLVLFPAVRPDEGQWLPEQFLKMDWEALKKRGMELTRDEFWHPEEGGVLSAAVQINGCSASLISDQGLVITNHHCAFGAIQAASTVENNLVEKGFVADAQEDEIPARGITMFELQRIEDVTERVHAAAAGAKTDTERHFAVEAESRKIESESKAAQTGIDCRVSSFLNGRKFLAQYRLMIPDVRLVYAPPRAIGEFGGEEDNWIWPRHTGDFTMLRAYVGPDGKPARYSKDNVPYRPKHWLKVAPKGVSDGDLVMILGYPGRTERYLTSVAVSSRQENLFPNRYDIYTRVIEILEKSTKGDPKRALRMQSTIKSLANVQKNSLGMVKGLPRNRVVARKLEEEKAFREWVAADGERKERYGTVLDDLMEIDREASRSEHRDLVMGTAFRQAPLLTTMLILAYAAEEKAKPEGEREAGWQKRQLRNRRRSLRRQINADELAAIEKPVMAVLLDHALKMPEGGRFSEVHAMAEGVSDPGALVEKIYGATEMLDPDKRIALYDEGWEAVRASQDPLVRLGRAWAEAYRHYRHENWRHSGRMLKVGALWIEAQEKWRGQSFYPDANSTLRVSVATVKGYVPRDGAVHTTPTTLRGVLEKESGQSPFASPKELLAAAQKDLGRFADEKLGDVPVCFLMDGDTTGGNSGSPIINGKGELVGVNFDRVFENVPGDFGWNPDRSRNIGVEIRYALWIMDKVYPCHRLLKELGL